jgi:uncharacterized protein YjiK
MRGGLARHAARLSAMLSAAAATVGVATATTGGAPPGTVLARYHLDGAPDDRWKLPKALNEISGLAIDHGRLYAHGDEEAVVYQLDPASHRVVSRFALGRPAVRGDFEAITIVEGRVFLTTSDGELFVAPLGEDGASVPYQRYVTGIGRNCEVEGLAWDPGQRTLLFGCKTPRVSALEGRLTVFAWSPTRRAAPTLRLSIPRSQVTGLGREAVYPSELMRDAATGHLLLLAARAHAIIELSPAGEVLAVAPIERAWHRQAEGLAIAPDGALLVADEGAGQHATLTTYRAAR